MVVNLQSIFLHISLSKGSGVNKTKKCFLWARLEYTTVFTGVQETGNTKAKRTIPGFVQQPWTY
jgi:hypothetical protein